MALNRRRLGKNGPEITTVGFGAWAVGGPEWGGGWGRQEDGESIAAIRHAVELGINWVDTAAIYGHGHSEEVVAEALQGISASERPLIFTKGAQRWNEQDPFAAEEQDLSPASIRRSCEASLRRLRVDQIDLLQFHWPDEKVPVEESWGELGRLADEGKVRWLGLSNYDVEQLEACERIRHVDSLQPPFSLITRDTASQLLGWCEAHGTGVIVYSPMESGLLSGRFSAERARSLPDDDWRKRADEFNEPKLSRNLEVAETLRQIAERRRVSVPAIAVAWTLAWPGVTAAIVGARRPEQVDDWVQASSLELDESDLEELAATLQRTGAGSGPVAPARVAR